MINFFAEDIDYALLDEAKTKKWLESILLEPLDDDYVVNYIFCSDDYLLGINRQYLSHDYYTDIITFQTSEDPEPLEADIFISIDRVKENGETLSIPFEKELHRVMVHGLIHLMGFSDQTDDQKREMRNKEDSYLSLLKF